MSKTKVRYLLLDVEFRQVIHPSMVDWGGTLVMNDLFHTNNVQLQIRKLYDNLTLKWTEWEDVPVMFVENIKDD